jgi:hypothetical protein
MTARKTPLLHRRERQRRKADDVTGRVDVGDGRLIGFVDRDATSLIGSETRVRKAQSVGVRLASDSIEQRSYSQASIGITTSGKRYAQSIWPATRSSSVSRRVTSRARPASTKTSAARGRFRK